jgi:hypothetical protein
LFSKGDVKKYLERLSKDPVNFSCYERQEARDQLSHYSGK